MGGRIARPTSFGAWLRTLRIAANLSQVELAQRAGLSAKAIGALERGERRRPRPYTRRRLAAALGGREDEWRPLLSDGASPAPAPSPPPAELGRQPGPHERAAAWELYVELITRIAVAHLSSDRGLLREALDSLYSLFATARIILKRHGAELAGDARVVRLTVAVLDEVLRPVLSEWHPLLLDHESRRPPEVSGVQHERAWARNQELRAVLAATRVCLAQHASRLADLAAEPDVHD